MGIPPPQAERWMRKAIGMAHVASRRGDRPFGCIIVNDDGKAIGYGMGTGINEDPTRHSEIAAIQMASATVGGLLEGCSIYSTHEPCLMCTGAILHAHLPVVVFGSSREDLPSLFRAYSVIGWRRWRESSHAPLVAGGILRDECVALFDTELSEAHMEAGA